MLECKQCLLLCLSSTAPSACVGKPKFAGAPVIANEVQKVRGAIKTSDTVGLQSYSTVVPFGETDLNLTLARLENCTHGGPLDICSLCEAVRGTVHVCVYMCVCVYMRARMCVHVRVCVSVRVCVCMCVRECCVSVCVHVHA